MLYRWLALAYVLATLAATVTPYIPAPSGSAASIIADSEAVQQSPQSSGYLEIHGAWGKTHLRVYIISSGSNELDEAMMNAVKLWYKSIKIFTVQYGYRYLESLSYEFTDINPDIVIQFVDSLASYCGLAEWRYTESRMISSVTIKISRSCVRTSAHLTYIVTAHEYGHALGLGHSSNNRDIMYPYVSDVAKLSTLDLYALAVAYEWVPGGVFRTPSASSVYLPSGMPFEYIEPDIRRILRVLKQSELGTTTEVYDVAYGLTIDLQVQEVIDFGNQTKLVFAGWFLNGTKVGDATKIRVRVTRDLELVARYDVYYFVEVSTPGKRSAEWVRRGVAIELNTTDVIPLGEYERLHFRRWSDNSTESHRTVVVLKPLKLEAVYAKEFYISVTSTHGSIDGYDGWYEEGSTIGLKAPSEVLWENRTKAVFIGWGGLNSTEPNTKIIASRPMAVKAIYKTQYYLDILSQLPVSHSSGWFDRGSKITVDAGPEIRPAGEGVRYRFGGWLGYGEGLQVEVNIDAPKTIQASWLREYLISVENPVEKSETWIAEGGNITIEASPMIQVSDVRRYVFKGWSGDVDSYEGFKAQLVANRPKKAAMLYDEELLVNLFYEDRGGRLVAATAVIKHENGKEYRIGDESFWALKGSYKVLSILFRNVEVKDASALSLDTPGQHKLPVKVYSLKLVARDLLGMPFAGAIISVSNDNSIEAEATLNGDGETLFEQLTHKAVNANLKTPIFSYRFTVDPAKGSEEVSLPLTPASAALLTATALAVGLMLMIVIKSREPSEKQS